ncbi:MAG: restriction endonuclease subunit S [Bacteroidales bacterium]|nr:restriction endonuclease subunit S [Bacteroidales bacterium]
MAVTGFHKTEVGNIPSNWDVQNLIKTSVLKARIGWQGLTTKEYLNSGDYYLITGTDFIDGRIKWDTCHYVEKSRFAQDKNIQVKERDILITKDGTIGKAAYIDKIPLPATLNSGVFVIRPINGAYLPVFVFYVFKSIYFTEFLNKLVAGSTINHLYQKDFVSFKFPLPPLPEQKAIAEVLSDTDNLIHSLEKQIAKKSLIKQGVMQKLLSPKKGWEIKKIDEISDVKSGKRLPKGSLLSDIKTPYPYIRVIDMYNGSVFIEDIKYVPENIFPVIKNYRIYKDDIFISVAGTLGVCGKIPIKLDGANLTENANRFTNITCDRDYLLFYLLSDTIQNKIESERTLGAQPKLALTRIRDFEIALPKTKSEQHQIATILSDMDKEIEILEVKLNKYKSLKQGLMQNLLTGKIRL